MSRAIITLYDGRTLVYSYWKVLNFSQDGEWLVVKPSNPEPRNAIIAQVRLRDVQRYGFDEPQVKPKPRVRKRKVRS